MVMTNRTWAYISAASVAFLLGACTISEPNTVEPTSIPPAERTYVVESDVISGAVLGPVSSEDPNQQGEIGTAVSLERKRSCGRLGCGPETRKP